MQILSHFPVEHYMRNSLTKSAGAYVTLHAADASPDIFGKSVTLSPGRATRISVQRSDVYRLETPYKSACKDDWSSEFPPQWQPYNLQICIAFVKALAIKEKCGCWMALNAFNGALAFNPRNFSFCSRDKYECVDQVLQEYADGNSEIRLMSFCRPKCYEETYQVWWQILPTPDA